MKISRLFSIVVFSLLLLLAGNFTYQGLFRSGGGSGAGFGYGNLWVQYSIRERGILGKRVESLIATPEFPAGQGYDGRFWTYTYKNGKVFRFTADGKHLVWVDPNTGAREIPMKLAMETIDGIRAGTKEAMSRRFDSPDEFVKFLHRNVPSDPG